MTNRLRQLLKPGYIDIGAWGAFFSRLGSRGRPLGRDIIFTVSFIALVKLIASCIPLISNKSEWINFRWPRSLLLSWVLLAVAFGLIEAAKAAYHLMSPETGTNPAMILVLVTILVLFVGSIFLILKYYGTRDGKVFLRAYRK
jgi:hypothetical protein